MTAGISSFFISSISCVKSDKGSRSIASMDWTWVFCFRPSWMKTGHIKSLVESVISWTRLRIFSFFRSRLSLFAGKDVMQKISVLFHIILGRDVYPQSTLPNKLIIQAYVTYYGKTNQDTWVTELAAQ
jgi:hypothetical protein